MTADIPAGRELDALVHELVMGLPTMPMVKWTVVPGQPLTRTLDPFGVPAYSTDISAAWLVVEKLQEQGVRVDILSDWHGHRTCRVARKSEILYDALDWSDTAPLAICRAALRAVRQ
mgnify:CR=1 FL=1